MPPSAVTQSSLYPLAILDCGSSSLRLTLQPTPPTHSLPPIYLAPNAIARTRPPTKKIFIGSDIEANCTDFSGLTLRLPLERGFITDWFAQKVLWDVEISKALAKLSTKDLATSSSGKLLEGWNLITAEGYFNFPELETGLEVMWFEEYGVRGLWRSTGAQLASFAPLQKAMTTTINPESPVIEENPICSAPATADADDAELGSPTKRPASSPSAVRGPPAASRRQKRQSVTTQAVSEPKSKSKPAGAVSRIASHRRPEASVVVDLGHSYTHVVPIVQGEVAWAGVRRLDIGGKLMTNLLKEMISFQQWDMMEESWIISHLKERAFFVAASDLEEERGGPSGWTKEKLLQLARRRKGQNPIEQEYVLPDYTEEKVCRNSELRYGRIRKGPGKWESTKGKKIKVDPKSPTKASAKGDEEGDLQVEEKEADAFIADTALLETLELSASGNQADGAFGTEARESDDSDEDAGEDYQESGSESGRDSPIKGSFQAHQQQQRVNQPSKRNAGGGIENEEEQVLVLANERWQIPELLFNPQQIGLDALPLPQLILSSIFASSSDDALRGMMFANITLIGGLAHMTNLRRRLEVDLRSLAPLDLIVRVRVPASPSMAAIIGGLHLPKGFLTGKLITREEWEKAGQGTVLSREKFLGWASQAARYLSKML